MSTVVSKNVQIGADGTASNNFTAYQPSTPDGTLRIGNGNSGSVTDAIVLNSSGNVGIGTTSTTGKLNVAGNVAIADGGWFGFGDVNERIAGNNAGYLQFFTDGYEAMRLTSTGLGIGTSSPLSALDVSNSFITVSKGATTTGRMGSSDYIVGGTDNDFVLQSSGTGVTRFVQTSSERMRIDSSGNLLVGTTSSNGRKLRVYGSGDLVELVSTNSGLGGAQIDLKHESASPADGDIVGLINFAGYDSGNNNTQYASIQGVASSVSSETGELRFGTRTNSSTYNSSAMVITSSGNVGINTTAPATALHILSSAAESKRTLRLAYDGTYYAELAQAGAGGLYYRTFGGAAHVWQQAGAEAMRIDGSGNVGIGTSSPTNGKLEVQTSATTAGLWVQTGGTTSSYTIADFRTGSNVPALVVKGNGSVGIGTDSPTSQISFGANVGKTLAVFENAGGNNIYGIGMGGAGTAGDPYRTKIFANGFESLSVDYIGNLLVGKTSQSGSEGIALVRPANTATYIYMLKNTQLEMTMGAKSSTDTNFYVGTGSSAVGTYGVYLTNTGNSWNAVSDERKKNIIEPIENGLEKVNSLRAVIGSYKHDPQSIRRPFLIAQDVQAVLPEAVNIQDEEDGTLGMSYTDIIPLLVVAIQELKAENDALKARLDAANL